MKANPLFRGFLAQRILKSFEAWLIGNSDLIVCSAGLKDHVEAIDPSSNVRQWRYADG
jgi:hypothetical protein